MKTIFLDTVGLLALWDRTDQWHALAAAALEKIGPHVATVTTSFVMLECANSAARKPYRREVNDAREKLQRGGKLIAPTDADWELAWIS